MRLIDADSVLKGIEELKRSPWYNRGKEVVSGDPGFQHIGYIERKEAVDTVRDLCIHAEPTVGGWVSVKDRLPRIISEDFDDYSEDVLVMTPDGIRIGHCEPYRDGENAWFSSHDSVTVTHWMPLPEPPES